MERHLAHPLFPVSLIATVLGVVVVELALYGIMVGVPTVWATLLLGGFYIGYIALFRRDALPAIFALLFFTAHHSLVFYAERDLPIALLFILIFVVNTSIMWLLLRYATHLKPEYQLAYSIICGFMIAQILTVFASMSRDWPFRFELAAYIPTAFSYIFWRFACLSSEAMLGWKQFMGIVSLLALLTTIIIIGSPTLQV